MKSPRQMCMLLLAIVFSALMAGILFTPTLAGEIAPTNPTTTTNARPPHQDPTPTPPPPPGDDGGNIFQNITQLINFPFASLVEAIQNAMQEILRAALAPMQSAFEAVLSLWLQNPGILSNGNAALPGWDLMRDAWQFMYSIAIAFWPLTLAVVAAIAAKDAVAAATWGLGDLKSALGTWFAAVLLSATSLWWMDLANNLANAITSYILYNFAGQQFFPSTFMILFSVILPGLFLAFPLVGIILIIFLLILAITIFIGLTFAIIARLVLMYLLVALGPLAIILGVLPPLRFVTHMWTRGLLLVLALGPIDALLLKLAFNVAQYASSAPPMQAVAAFIGVFGLLSILITINFTLVKTVFGAVIAVANQTLRAVQAVGQMVVAGALLMSGAGAGIGAAMGGGAAASSGGGGGLGPAGGGIASAGGSSGGMSPNISGGAAGNAAANGNGKPSLRPSGRGMAAAGSYLQSTRGPLAGFGALLRAAGIDQTQQERAGMWNAREDGNGTTTLENFGSAQDEKGSPEITYSNGDADAANGTGIGHAATQRERNAQPSINGETNRTQTFVPSRAPNDASARGSDIRAATQAPNAQKPTTPSSGNLPTSRAGGGVGARTSPIVSSTSQKGTATRAPSSVPPRRANISAIQESRAAMGFDSGAVPNTKPTSPPQANAFPSSSVSAPLKTIPNDDSRTETNANVTPGSSFDVGKNDSGATIDSSRGQALGDERRAANEFENVNPTSDAIVSSRDDGNNISHTPMLALAPEAERTLSMLPDESGDARTQAAQLVNQYSDAGQQSQTASALEQGMRIANEQHGIAWSNMSEAVEHGLWSTREAANHHIPINDMARQMEPFTSSRDAADYVAWQIAGRGEQFHAPSQQVPYLSAPGPYEYQAGRHIEQQLGGAIGYQDAAKLFYVMRDPSTPGGGWNKGQQFIGEVNRISSARANEPLLELDRWMQANAPTRARVLWNIHMKIVDGKS